MLVAILPNADAVAEYAEYAEYAFIKNYFNFWG
jgi:hypothetical protein